MRINIDVSMPIYQQIIDEIKRAVARGDLKPGDKLPSHREMAGEIKVNPNTVQRAYREMEQGKLVATLRGHGTFINDDPMLIDKIRREMADSSVSSFVREMMALGFTQGVIISLVIDKMKEWPGGLSGESSGEPPGDSPSDLPGDLPGELSGEPSGGLPGKLPGDPPGDSPDDTE
jgi:GntR family transcriptional regulator